jgi:predicted DNA-binding transcriptional regulator YafY
MAQMPSDVRLTLCLGRKRERAFARELEVTGRTICRDILALEFAVVPCGTRLRNLYTARSAVSISHFGLGGVEKFRT